MASTPSIAASGLHTAQTRLNASAHNIANLDTAGFHRQEVRQTEQAGGGVSSSLTRSSVTGAALETDVVAQLQAQNVFLVNLEVFKTNNRLAGALLDKTA